MVDKFPTIESRLEYVRAQTGCPAKSHWARWIGAASAQAAHQWESRDSLPRDAALKVNAATGAALGWLLTGKGEPFPNGPTAYPGAVPASAEYRLRAAEDQIDALSQVMTTFLQVFSAKMPAVSGELLAALSGLEGLSGSQKQILEAAVDSTALGLESSGSAGRSAARAESPGKLQRKGR